MSADVWLALVVGTVLGGALVALLGRPLLGRTREERKALEQKLERLESGRRESEQIARLAAETNPDAIVIYGGNGLIHYANAAAREVFFEGKVPDGQNFLRLLGEAPEHLKQALLGDSDRLFTVQVQQQHETYHVCRCPVTMEGEPHTLLIVKHLTREVSRHELETLKKVIRVLSHEANNSLAPITSLVSSGRLLAGKPEHAAKLASVFDTIEERARHLSGFLAGYAGLARLPAPKPRAVDWAAFLGHLGSLHPGLKLPEPPARPGFFDPAQIEQVAINLVKNAVEAGSAEPEVELAIDVEEDGTTRMELRDRGRGLTGEALESALLPFYTTKEKGSGLGLALCREIVQAHGGSLALANRAGGGALVAIVLPGEHKADADVTRSRARLTLSRY